MDNNKVPQIRDMTAKCKECGNYHFPDALNKQGLCYNCANGITKEKPQKEYLFEKFNI